MLIGNLRRFVVAVDKEKASKPEGAHLFRSYKHKDNLEHVYLWQAARATSAAPTFFKPEEIGSKHFVDGGLGYNNPTILLINEAEEFFSASEIGCLVSIGTGVQRGKELAAKSSIGTKFFLVPIVGMYAAMADASVVMKDIATSSEFNHQRALELFARSERQDAYHRFNVSHGMDIQLNECYKIPAIRYATETYLNEPATQSALQECVSKLRTLDNPENLIPIGSRRTLLSGKRHPAPVLLPSMASLLETVDLATDLTAESLSASGDHIIRAPLSNSSEIDNQSLKPCGYCALVFQIALKENMISRKSIVRSSQGRHLFPKQDVAANGPIRQGRWAVRTLFMIQSTQPPIQEMPSSNRSPEGALHQMAEHVGSQLNLEDQQGFYSDTATIKLYMKGYKSGDEVEDDSSTNILFRISAERSFPCYSFGRGWDEMTNQSIEGQLIDLEYGDEIIFELSWELQCSRAAGNWGLRLLFGGIRYDHQFTALLY
jgi:predicted acylesterase/phospholipase RssA